MFMPGKYLQFHLKDGSDLYLNNVVIGLFLFIWIFMLSWYSLKNKEKMVHFAACGALMVIGVWFFNLFHLNWLWVPTLTILVEIGVETTYKFNWRNLWAGLISVGCLGLAYWFWV